MNHTLGCAMTVQALAYQDFIRRENTVADTYTDEFEAEPQCTCVEECAGCEKPQTDTYTIAGQPYCWSCFESYDEEARPCSFGYHNPTCQETT